MIEIQEVIKRYRTDEVETTALNGVNLNIESGQFVAVMGPSGCGKSTLLNVIGLLDRPDQGKLFLNGTEVSAFTNRQRADFRKNHIGFVFQSFNLIEELNVFENVELPLIYAGLSTAERKRSVEARLEQIGIAHRAKHFPYQLSGGQQQRVAVARAIVNNPALILADEPTGNLDSQHGKAVMNLLTELNQGGTTVVMVTHNPADAAFATREIRMLDGLVHSETGTLQKRSL